MEQLEKIEKCTICFIPTNKFCSTCKKVYYCSSNHQKIDRKKHRKDCFPAILITDKIQGRHFVATKDLNPNDLVFKDKAIVSGPSGAETFFYKICLGCYRVVKSLYKCTKCKWPVCSTKCEKVKHHAEFECKIFEKQKIQPYFTKPFEYDFIKFLRSLLLKDKDENKWKELMNLSSHVKERSENQSAISASIASYQFINSICKLEHFDYNTVDYIVGVWGVNSFGANPPSGSVPIGSIASFLFPRTSLASHNCIANTRGILLEEIHDSVPTYSMELLASLSIKTGSEIYITYTDISEGTFERRQILLDNYYFSCNCPRCQDPTEFGTYLSAFKCPKCSNGYLLMKEPLNFNTSWNCDKCTNICLYKNLINIIYKIKTELNSINNDNKNISTTLEKILKENQGITVHTNHWLMMEVEFQLIQQLLIIIKKTKHTNLNFSKMENLIDISNHCLNIANIIRPGHNAYRGKILYCLSQAKLESIMRTTTTTTMRDGNENIDLLLQRENIEYINKSAEESLEILSREPERSEEGRIAIALKDDLVKIKKMLTLLDSQLKVGIFC